MVIPGLAHHHGAGRSAPDEAQQRDQGWKAGPACMFLVRLRQGVGLSPCQAHPTSLEVAPPRREAVGWLVSSLGGTRQQHASGGGGSARPGTLCPRLPQSRGPGCFTSQFPGAEVPVPLAAMPWPHRPPAPSDSSDTPELQERM